jgi:hypothetical protein
MNRTQRNAAKMLERILTSPRMTYDPMFDTYLAIRSTSSLRIRRLRALGLKK